MMSRPTACSRSRRRAGGRPVPGTDLGLFIVGELARAQGGDAWYERDESGRPCFSFALPGRVAVG